MSRVVLLGLLLGCGSGSKSRPLSEVVADYPAAATVVAKAEKLFQAGLPPAPATAEIVKARLPPNDGALSSGIKLDGPPIKLTMWTTGDAIPKELGNATLIDAAGIGDLTKRTYGEVEFPSGKLVNVLTDCAALVRTQKLASAGDGESVAPKYLAACSKLQYVLVLRAVAAVAPTEDLKAKTYSPGQFYGDVLVYGLASGRFLGNILIDITESSTGAQLAGSTAYSFSRAVETKILAGLKKYAGV